MQKTDTKVFRLKHINSDKWVFYPKAVWRRRQDAVAHIRTHSWWYKDDPVEIIECEIVPKEVVGNSQDYINP